MVFVVSALKTRIVGLGDSTTAGTPGFLSPLEAPPNGRGNIESQYAYWMMQIHPEWIVLNRGVNGERSDEILARFERDVLPELPNYVVILAGVNDVYQGVPIEPITENLIAMYEKATAAKIRAIAATILPYNTASPLESNAISNLNGWIAKATNRLGILFCDTNRSVRDPRNPDRLLGSPDGLHPDVSGYRKMGESLAKTIDGDSRLV
jgi:lysophospholipase L1-like esterase